MEKTAFPGIRQEMLDYFVGIGLNNNRDFFLRTHEDYEKNVRDPLYALAEGLLPAARELEPDLEELPRRIVSHIRRDTRFTKDKSPYRDHMWLTFRSAARNKWECFCLYYAISLEESGYGAGYYYNDPARARWFREKLPRQQEEFLAVICDPEFAARFVIEGDEYKKIVIPEKLDPRLIPLYVKKSFSVWHSDGLDEKIGQPEYLDEIAEGFRILKPLYRLMNDCTD